MERMSLPSPYNWWLLLWILTGKGCLERLRMPHPWQGSRTCWMGLWTSCSSQRCLYPWLEVENRWSLRFSLSQISLRFYKSKADLTLGVSYLPKWDQTGVADWNIVHPPILPLSAPSSAPEPALALKSRAQQQQIIELPSKTLLVFW